MATAYALALSLAQRRTSWMHDDDDWWLMALVMGGFWVVLILGIVWIVRGGHLHGAHHAPAPERPLAILQRRLAEGEITPAEYEERRRLLLRTEEGAPASDPPVVPPSP